MEEGAHSHGHRPHGTGTRWLDISLALSACFVSVSREPHAVKACAGAALPYAGH
jgi:hypothetical protein